METYTIMLFNLHVSFTAITIDIGNFLPQCKSNTNKLYKNSF